MDRNLRMDYQFITIFGINILDTTGHQMTIYVPASPSVCFSTTRGKQTMQNITFFLFNAVSLIGSNNTYLAHFVQIFSTVADIVSSCLVVQLVTVNI